MIAILVYLLQIVCIGGGLAIGAISLSLVFTTRWKQYVSGYCRRHLVAFGGAYFGGLMMLIPIALSEIKGFLFLVSLSIIPLIIILAYYYLVICPPWKRRR